MEKNEKETWSLSSWPYGVVGSQDLGHCVVVFVQLLSRA